MATIECYFCEREVDELEVVWILEVAGPVKDDATGVVQFSRKASRTNPRDGSVPACPACAEPRLSQLT
jgi:hypothetical protein